MRIRIGLALLILLAAAGLARAQDNPIVNRMAAFAEAYNAGDAAAIAGFYTEEGAVLPPQGRAVVGRDSIRAHYARAFDGGVGGLEYRIVEIRQHGPAAAVEIGETRVKAGGQTILGRSMHVWVMSGGAWYLSRDMYHVLGVAD
ncbi:MAG: SgcJ/EcaC family oxidoreductase [Rhizobiaceae bacterium]